MRPAHALKSTLVLLTGFCFAQDPTPTQEPMARFGTTVVKSSGFRGEIYLLRPETDKLPNFRKLRPEGTIYTTRLDVPPMAFSAGFPGVTGRFEWFAIDYTAQFWIEHPGLYRFALLSDDGSKLYIDDRVIIKNDGIHPPEKKSGEAVLLNGLHRIRVSYFQGPRFQVALVLSVAGPGEQFHVFDADAFVPPVDTQ
jgi:hypothetical protein